ncbi:fumarylacetoacetate hydrolase family protein [Robertmurraya korlensis]|uniref:fumarylacetoacetate hydrolase family protein n=1 Tax=Robertmurraya korlensis TaxID=519977 RepID=UPI0008241811|nr:fumarylacetoacetate hydrolase family protein [Robertmurraya korlensis]
MKLITFSEEEKIQIGVIQDQVTIKLNTLSDLAAKKNGNDLRLPNDMLGLISLGKHGIDQIETLLSWLEENDSYKNEVQIDNSLIRVLAPISNPGKVVCVGNNYMDHCIEQNVEPPKQPMIFSKWASCIIGPNDTVILPEDSEQVDYEAELAVIIGKEGKDISEDQALDYIYGYTVMNDVSARDVQFKDVQWVRGKSYDTFAPLGPTIVTADEIKDPHNLDIKLTVNGETLQDSNTKHLIHKIPYIISYLSRGFTFKPGDVIATGTPHGVGVFRNPPIFLKRGDVCKIEIQNVGVLENTIY